MARTLEKDSKTIKSWLCLLEELYIIFKITPYSKNISRSLLKEPKYYFFDFGRIEESQGGKLENLVACALLKELNFVEDIYGVKGELHFLKTKEGKEIDFLVSIDGKPVLLIEVKNFDDDASKNFNYFESVFPTIKKVQLVKNILREKTYPNGLEIRSLTSLLRQINFQSFCVQR